jgi:hypothetical protein
LSVNDELKIAAEDPRVRQIAPPPRRLKKPQGALSAEFPENEHEAIVTSEKSSKKIAPP